MLSDKRQPLIPTSSAQAGQEAINLLASIVETSEDAILGKTLEGIITRWNGGAERLYGYSAEEVLGKSVSILIPPDRKDELSAFLARIKAGDAIKNYETVRLRKDGTPREVSVSISPIRDARGRITGASTIAHNITQLKEMIRELERKNSELLQERYKLTTLNLDLEEANRVRSQFLATMSHELRTPLASIVGFSEILLEDSIAASWDQQQRDNLKRILKNSEHLLNLINDVLDISKIEAGRIELDFSQVDIKELLVSVIEETRSLAHGRHLVLRTEVEEGIDYLETNPTKLHQILLNLVSNAIKFTEQGSVTLSATRVLYPEQGIAYIAFAVKDTGIGMPQEIHGRIFEAFYQADGSYTRKVGGTGLGLSIVSKLTTFLGGTITVESIPGQGSTFTVLLPEKVGHQNAAQNRPRLHQKMQAQEASTSSPSTAEPVPATLEELLEGVARSEVTGEEHNLILAVDDDPDVHLLIKAALQGTPFRVVGVHDPLKVMDVVQKLNPCAITLDVMMPHLNGWQLLYQLKDNAATASIPVVVVSVLAEQATGYVLGADEYLIKPFKKEALLNALKNAIEMKQPHRII